MNIDIERLPQLVKNNKSYASVLRELGLKTSSYNYEQIKQAIQAQGLSTAHFKIKPKP